MDVETIETIIAVVFVLWMFGLFGSSNSHSPGGGYSPKHCGTKTPKPPKGGTAATKP